MNRFYFYEKINGQKIKCRMISQIRIENTWKNLTDKLLPEIIAIYVSDKKFKEIHNELYGQAPKTIKNRIDRAARKEWGFKGQLSMDGGFVATDSSENSVSYLLVIRSKDYIKEKSNKILQHELIHIIENT